MKRLTLILIALVTYSLLASNHCRKDPTSNAKLPPATQEGRNTVGFMIDDEVWVPYYECRFMGDPCGEIHSSYGEAGGAISGKYQSTGIGIAFYRKHLRYRRQLTCLVSQG